MNLPGMPHLGTYDLIDADCPWPHQNYGQAKHGAAKSAYDEMPMQCLQAMPVGALAAPTGCLLFLWCTGAQAADGAHINVADAWGFELRTRIFSWVKIVETCQACGHRWGEHVPPGVTEDFPGACTLCPTSKRASSLKCDRFYPKAERGPGSYSMQGTEDVWLGVRGSGWSSERAERDVPEPVFWPITEHSAKPDLVQARIERLWPEATSRLELFARRRRPGWKAWGNQAPDCDLVFGREIGPTWPVPRPEPAPAGAVS